MKNLYILILFLTALLASSCHKELPDPDTDAVFKSISKVYELNTDGSINYQYKHQLKYLRHLAFNRLYGESFIVYHPEKQKLTINKSLTTQADGTQVASPENAYNEVLPFFAAGAPAFNHLREMVVTHAGLELGCVVDFDYELTSQADYIPFMHEHIILAKNSPIQKMEIIVKVPEGTTLNYKLLNADKQPKITTKKGVTAYKWVFEQLNSKCFEHNQPHFNSTLPRLIFSTATLPDALKVMPQSNPIPAVIASIVDEKLKKTKTVYDQIFALQQLVATEINKSGIPFEHTGYHTRNFNEIWKTNEATDVEKTAFLAALLNHYQIKATPVLAYQKQVFDRNIGLLKDANLNYVLIDLKDESLLISATETSAKNNLIYHVDDKILVDYMGNEIEINRDAYNQTSKLNIKVEGALNKQGTLNGKADLALTGSINPYFDWLKDNKNADGIAKNALQGIDVIKADLMNWNASNANISIDFELKDAAKKQENYFFLTIPKSALGLNSHHFDVLTEQRKSPMEIGGPLEEIFEMKLQVPDNYILVMGDVDTILNNPMGEVQIQLDQTTEGLVIYKKIVLNKKVVTPDEYPDFRNLYLLWNQKNLNEIALKETQP